MKSLLLTLAFLSCCAAAKAPQGPPATIGAQCAPWDGAAIGIEINARMEAKDQPRIFIALFKDLPNHGMTEPHTYQIEGMQSQAGSASVCKTKEDGCESAASGKLILESSSKDWADGSYDLVMKDGQHHRGRFHAKWVERRIFCG